MAKQNGAEKADCKEDAKTRPQMLAKESEAKMLEAAKRLDACVGSGETDKKIKELEERLIRLQADFQNHIKRSERRETELADVVRANMLADILPIVDQLEAALHHEKTGGEFRKGVEMIYTNLMGVLRNTGLKEMGSYEKFDPYLHEAMRVEKGEDGRILEVVQKGYMFKGKVLRHAKVVVGRKE